MKETVTEKTMTHSQEQKDGRKTKTILLSPEQRLRILDNLPADFMLSQCLCCFSACTRC